MRLVSFLALAAFCARLPDIGLLNLHALQTTKAEFINFPVLNIEVTGSNSGINSGHVPANCTYSTVNLMALLLFEPDCCTPQNK